MKNELMNPCGAFETKDTPLAPRQPITKERVIGLFCNDKKNADVLLKNVEALLQEKYGALEFIWFNKGASVPAKFTKEFTDRCDMVVAAIAD